jgi:hypothetical protein
MEGFDVVKYHPVSRNNNTRFGNDRKSDFSSKMNREVFLSSSLEYDHWVLMETDPNVVAFCEQPEVAVGEYNGKKRFSIFDAWVQYQDGSEEFFEIKYSSDLEPKSRKYEEVLKQVKILINHLTF